jgi:hypothetical protein
MHGLCAFKRICTDSSTAATKFSDNNTITIAFVTAVPLWERCRPIMTFSGFQEAFAHVNGMPDLLIDVDNYIPL